ncbi:MAG: aminotransferase class I/II-fold pyridoxal phosphate-dependent enzyme [Actinomycetota bacterium]|nr:aminotransferase class I/II-fold pyridoxal phosphate-dependent enzyme [Acidimicrobiia bacterium]MDQ3294359.1 aminotransferase class I/II-fold pyridoxal phosphate-dependent enzyme [Actinomycetota bacterium]
MTADPRIDTTAVGSGRRSSGDSLAPVLWPSTTYEVDSVDDHRRMTGQPRTERYYSRFGSPTAGDFADAVAELEGAEAGLAFSSGMAAVTATVLGLCQQGDHVVVTRQLFSVSTALFALHCPRFGIDVTFVDGTDAEAIAAAAATRPTQLVFVETPANPTLSLVDIEAVAAIKGPITVVDSTFATPVVQRPLELGIDLVLHSATKGLAGHNDALLGVIAGERDVVDAVWAWNSVMGGTASPFDAWNGIRGIRTMPVRVRQQSATALHLAQFLESHPAVESVSYPFLPSHPQHELATRQMATGGVMVTFVLRGGAAAGRAFCESVALARLALSLGGPESLVSHPATIVGHLTPEERSALGIADGLIRYSVGLEHADDLEADLAQALDKAAAAEGAS